MNLANIDLNYRIMDGDCEKRLHELKRKSIDCIFTSPREMKSAMDMWHIVRVSKLLMPILKDEGSYWLNIGESHDDLTGRLPLYPMKAIEFITKDLIGGSHWVVRDLLIWHKPPMDGNKFGYGGEEAVSRFKHDYDFIVRFVKEYHEPYVYFDKTYSDCWASSVLSAPVRNVREGEPDSGYPHEIVADCLLTTCPPGGVVLDPYCGWGATGVVALERGMNFIGIEKDRSMIDSINKRMARTLAENKKVVT